MNHSHLFKALFFTVLFIMQPAFAASTSTKRTVLEKLVYQEVKHNSQLKRLSRQRLGMIKQICINQPGQGLAVYDSPAITGNTDIFCKTMTSALSQYGISVQYIQPVLSHRVYLSSGVGSSYVPVNDEGKFRIKSDPLFNNQKNAPIWIPKTDLALNYQWSKQLNTSIGWQKIYNKQETVDFIPIKAIYLF